MGNGLNKFETLMNNISEKGSRSQDIVSIIRNIDKTINTSNIILSCWDLDGNIEFANEFFFEFFGIEENLSLEKFSAHLFEIALSETNLNFNQAIENLRNDISNIQSEQFDLKLKINNKKRWANVIIVPVNDNDNKYYYLL